MKFMQKSLQPPAPEEGDEDPERELSHPEILRLGNRNEEEEIEEEATTKKVHFSESGLVENAALSAGNKTKASGHVSVKFNKSIKKSWANTEIENGGATQSSETTSLDEEILLAPFGETNGISSSMKKKRIDVEDGENPWISTENIHKPEHKARDPKQNKGKKKQSENKVELDMQAAISVAKREGFNLLANANKQQVELIERAFATSNVEDDFEKEKQALIEAKEKEEQDDGKLPGWGSWAGDGISSRKKKVVKKEEKEKKELDPKMKHVIIATKQMKQAEKYMLPHTPKPFTSKDQYERSIRTPIGKDWNTQTVFQKLTQPKIQTKAGIIIDPITREKANQELSEQPTKKKEQKSSLSGRKKG